MVVWSAERPRSRSNSSTSRYESENRRYQRTAQTMISGSKCRHLNSAGRVLIMEYTAAYQARSLSFCNIAAATIHLIAHSMGNRVLVAALHDIALQSQASDAAVRLPLFHHVVLTAPDIDADTFRELAQVF